MAKRIFFEFSKLNADSSGDDDALDSLDGDATGVEDGAKAFVTVSGYILYIYTLDADYGDVAGNPPITIKPLVNYGSKMWVLDSMFFKNLNLPITGILYFGDSNVNGSWKIERMGNNLSIFRREGGVWVEKGSFTP